MQLAWGILGGVGQKHRGDELPTLVGAAIFDVGTLDSFPNP
jgi:hypothetical protein